MGDHEMSMRWKETAQVGIALIFFAPRAGLVCSPVAKGWNSSCYFSEDEDYPAEGAQEEWEWDPEAELCGPGKSVRHFSCAGLVGLPGMQGAPPAVFGGDGGA